MATLLSGAPVNLDPPDTCLFTALGDLKLSIPPGHAGFWEPVAS